MCGINGIIGLESGQAETAVYRMNHATRHRGPDAEGTLVLPGIALGHQRLAIIDLDAAANQPMTDKTGRFTIVFNGEIYNYRSLRERLSSETFRTRSDTEVLLLAFRRWGHAVLPLLNGMFAFAVWDRETSELFLARDRLGIKPLYYAEHGGGLVFSSEVRGLLASGLVSRALAPDGLVDYLRYQTVHSPTTLLANVKALEAGTSLTYRTGHYHTTKWWSPVPPKFAPKMSGAALRRSVRESLYRSVERRLVSDVPIGAFLSGGIDSSAVVGVMSEVFSSQVETFNVSFDDKAFSEAPYARLVAKRFRTNHHEILLRPGELLEALPEALAAMDHPSADGPNTYVVSRATRNEGIKVALSGLGGDELFAGYDVFRRMRWLHFGRVFARFPKSLRARLGTAVRRALGPSPTGEKLAQVFASASWRPEHVYPVSRQVQSDPALGRLLNMDALPRNTVADRCESMFGVRSEHFDLPLLVRVSWAELVSYLQHVLLRDTDQMSMAHALEVRVPFLDHELVELMMRVSDRDRTSGGPKRLLTDALGSLVPEEVVHRPKTGFVLPWEIWMRTELRDFCHRSILSISERTPFAGGEVLRRWQAFSERSPEVSWSRIWMLVVLADYIDRHNLTWDG